MNEPFTATEIKQIREGLHPDGCLLQRSSATIDALTVERDEYKRQAQLYNADMMQVREQRDTIRAELAQAEKRNGERQQIIEADGHIVQMLAELLGGINARVMGSEGETPVEASVRIEGEMQHAIKSILSERDDLQAGLVRRTYEVDTLRAELADMKAQLSAAIEWRDESRQSVVNIADENVELRTQLAAAVSFLDHASGEFLSRCAVCSDAKLFLAAPSSAAIVRRIRLLEAEHAAALDVPCNYIDGRSFPIDIDAAKAKWIKTVAAVEAEAKS